MCERWIYHGVSYDPFELINALIDLERRSFCISDVFFQSQTGDCCIGSPVLQLVHKPVAVSSRLFVLR
jgi:hypothetical protein